MNESTADLIMETQADFALNLLREIAFGKNEEKSTILSPISAAIALSMVYAGAKGKTANSLNKLLCKVISESDADQLHAFFGTVLQDIKSEEKSSITLEMVDKVYVKDGFRILDSYKALIDRNYQGQFESVDFGQNQAAAKKINGFVSEATHDKIHDLISPGVLSDQTRMVLINAIYFKGKWADQFEPENTKEENFYISEGHDKQLDMMHKTHEFIYNETDEFQILGLPYVGDEVFMFIVLPRERFGLRQMLANLSGEVLLESIQSSHKEETIVALPKFKLESMHELNEPLKALGIANAFSNDADFSGISLEEPLKIDQVIQKAFVELTEEGTEAAAASGIVLVTRCSLSFSLKPKPKFVADHPFAFMLAKAPNRFGSEEEEATKTAMKPLFLFSGIFNG